MQSFCGQHQPANHFTADAGLSGRQIFLSSDMERVYRARLVRQTRSVFRHVRRDHGNTLLSVAMIDMMVAIQSCGEPGIFEAC